MFTRRKFMQRLAGMVGTSVMAQILPVGLAQAGNTTIPPEHPDSLVIVGCRFVRGNPKDNNPEWVEETSHGFILRDRTISVDGTFSVPKGAFITIIQSSFTGVTLVLDQASQATVTGCAFYAMDDSTEPLVRVFSEPGLTKSYLMNCYFRGNGKVTGMEMR